MLPSYCPSAPPSPTTSLSSGVILPSATIAVASTAQFNFDTNTISFGSSGTVTCTGTTSTSFTGCSGGLAGTYSVGTTVTSPNAAVTWCATTSGPPYQLKRYLGNKTVAGVAVHGFRRRVVDWMAGVQLGLQLVQRSSAHDAERTDASQRDDHCRRRHLELQCRARTRSPSAPSGTITCTGTTATSFTGCSGGHAGQYPPGMPVFSASSAPPPRATLYVSLVTDQTPADANQRFTLVDAIVLRNSRPY